MSWAYYPKGDTTARAIWSVGMWLRKPMWVPALFCSLLVAAALVDVSWIPLVLAGVGVLAIGQRLLCIRLRRSDYSSGDFRRVSAALAEEWSEGTAARRLSALALVGLGDFPAARRDLLSPRELDQEDRELRLCAQIVMLAFEGQALSALELCRVLITLPMASDGQERRRRARREGIIAIARALCGSADEDDYRALIEATHWEPALHWACCYGAAVACCVKSETGLARKLVERAPRWPKESVFHQLHSRILAVALA